MNEDIIFCFLLLGFISFNLFSGTIHLIHEGHIGVYTTGGVK
jgi:hypothetical protein